MRSESHHHRRSRRDTIESRTTGASFRVYAVCALEEAGEEEGTVFIRENGRSYGARTARIQRANPSIYHRGAVQVDHTALDIGTMRYREAHISDLAIALDAD